MGALKLFQVRCGAWPVPAVKKRLTCAVSSHKAGQCWLDFLSTIAMNTRLQLCCSLEDLLAPCLQSFFWRHATSLVSFGIFPQDWLRNCTFQQKAQRAKAAGVTPLGLVHFAGLKLEKENKKAKRSYRTIKTTVMNSAGSLRAGAQLLIVAMHSSATTMGLSQLPSAKTKKWIYWKRRLLVAWGEL